MLRRYSAIALVALIAATTLSSGGCRSCSDCHDYDPPVANCDCPGGINRAGSNSTCGCGCGESGASSGPSACGCGGDHGGNYEQQAEPTEVQAKSQQYPTNRR